MEMRKALDDPIRERTVVGKIRRLKQYTSAARYAAEFKKVAVNLEWEEDGLRDVFWKGLKNSIKDEFYKKE
jgi:hypothetical protein